MNTMADGAAKRLVAQIGEALFGQPGLTLMELAEKVRASQHSPTGQDAHELWAMAQLAPGEGIECGVRRIEAALAASQPVEETVEVLSCRVGNETSTIDKAFPAGTKLYHKPVQAVDLGQFRESVQYASRTCPHEDLAPKLRELLSLIDSQAVGNGR